MNAVRIVASFHIFVPQPAGHDGKPQPEKRQHYARGQSVPVDEIPTGQSAADWIEKGLAEALE